MTRTRLADRIMPVYTHQEEIFNEVSHIVGGGLSLLGGIYCIVITLQQGSWVGVTASIIYTLGNVLLYTMSSIYHGLPQGMPKRVFQVLDHCAIYIMIAGTYTPICLLGIARVNPTVAYGLLAFEWFMAILSITLNAIDLKSFRVFGMFSNLFMGWAVVFFQPLLVEACGMNCFWFILLGGILYSLGAILYGIGRKKSVMHCVFHVFVLAGSIFQFIGIAFYIL